jgi:AbrB family looped-hinge helix DNA binding protein
MGIQIKIAANGRMSIPADVRKQLGLEKGGEVTLDFDEFGMTLKTAAQRVAKAQALYRKYSKGRPGFTVDEFIAQKRADAALERY